MASVANDFKKHFEEALESNKLVSGAAPAEGSTEPSAAVEGEKPADDTPAAAETTEVPAAEAKEAEAAAPAPAAEEPKAEEEKTDA